MAPSRRIFMGTDLLKESSYLNRAVGLCACVCTIYAKSVLVENHLDPDLSDARKQNVDVGKNGSRILPLTWIYYAYW